jgi:hypothetical protein
MNYFSLFSSAKSENKREKQVLPGQGLRGIGSSGSGEVAGKGNRKVNMVQKVCIHACKCKTDTCWNCSMNQGRKSTGGVVKGRNSGVM